MYMVRKQLCYIQVRNGAVNYMMEYHILPLHVCHIDEVVDVALILQVSLWRFPGDGECGGGDFEHCQLSGQG